MSGKKYILLGLFAVLAFLPFIPYMATSSDHSIGDHNSTMSKCIFCDIVTGRIPETQFVSETDEFVIFKDIKPASTHHYLAVTKRHIESLKKLTKNDDALILRMQSGLKDFFTKQNINTNDALYGFHLPPFISVKHLHMHGIAPRSEMSFINRMVFRPNSAWFKTVEDARKIIQEQT